MEAILAVFASTDGDQQKGLHPIPVGQQGLPAPKFGVLQIHWLRVCSFRYDEMYYQVDG